MRPLLPLLLLVLPVAAGCAHQHAAAPGVIRYRPLEARCDGSPDAVGEATRSALTTLGAREITTVGDEVRAIFPGGRFRDRAVVTLPVRGVLRVAVRTEVETGGGWLAVDWACSSYRYSRERALADRIIYAVIPSRAFKE